MKPIRPEDIGAAKKAILPPEVIAAANEIITQNWNGSSARFTTTELAGRIRKKMDMGDNEAVAAKGWLDIEDVYRNEGWKVEFYKTGYSDPEDDYYIFTKRKDNH